MALSLRFRLLFKAIAAPLLLCVSGFILIFLLGDTADRLYLITSSDAIGPGLRYLVLRIPGNLTKLLPVATIVGVMFGFARMNRAGEIVAFMASGVSRVQMALPVLVLAGLVATCDFTIAETVAPICNRRAQAIIRVELHKEGPTTGHPAWIRSGDSFIVANGYDRYRHELHGVKIFSLSKETNLSAITQAPLARWNGQEWKLSSPWSLRVKGREVENGAQPPPLEISPTDLDLPMIAYTGDLSFSEWNHLNDLSLWELNRSISGLERMGQNPREYRNLRDLKYSLPCSSLILAAIGFCLSLEPVPRSSGPGRSFVLALAMGLGYWLMLAITMAFAKSGLLPAWAGAWLPNLAFGSIATALFLMGEEK
jgi:LPS export ABC transporter permease LptG